jgi:ketosteroid isomerase-like protein
VTDETESLVQIREAYRRWHRRRSGIAIDTPKADFLRLRAGRIVEFYEFYDTAMALAAARGESP